MNVWYSFPTIFNSRRALRNAGLIGLCVALITTFIFSSVSHALPNVTRSLTFQGRLLTSGGAVVADGHYNMQFKLYQNGSGTAAGNPDGTLQWTESYVNGGGTNGVEVKNGFFSVSLGAINPFGTSVDWNQDTLWLSMNIAGNASACSTFGAAPCVADGEMLPMKRITATPFALNSGAVGGKTADELVQLGQGVQTDTGNNSSIFINKTGSGNLVQLQAGGTDAFTLNTAGNITLGSAADQSISVATAASGAGKSLTVTASSAASGSNLAGGDVILQGGTGDGTAEGGNVIVKANGTDTTGTFQVQNTTGAAILNVDTTNSIVSAGTIKLVSIAASSADQISSDKDLTISSGGALALGSTDQTLSLQGSSIDIGATNGGNVTIQGGAATVSNGNGGSLLLSGGAGNGSGASGLVVLSTPTFSTVTSDVNCYTGGTVVASSCTLAASTINNASSAIIGFSVASKTATMPDPTITTAGRIIYVTAAGGSQTFTLQANAGTDAEQNITMRKNTTATLLWNGADWTVAGGSSSTSLQDAYSNAPQNAAGSDIVLSNDGTNTGGLTIRDSATNPTNSSLLDVKNAVSDTLFSVNSKVTDGTEHASDGGVHTGVSFAANWPAVGSATASRSTSDGQEGDDSAQVAAGTSADNGIRNNLSIDPQLSVKYQVSVYAKLASGPAFTDFKVRYSPDDGASFVDCSNYNTQTVTTSGWAQITCDITTSATAVTEPYIYLVQPTAPDSARTYLVDTLSFTLASNNTPNVKVGSGTGSGSITLFTLDKSASAPAAADNDSLLGSMYYDTVLGKVQCYESEGWGACGASPDIFVTISPEYTNAVMNGTDIGTITSDLCSDTLNINDGSGVQPTICGTNETYNFYKWTSAESTAQTRSIYVTYQLPSTFKNFAAGVTTLKARTNSADSNVNYQVYRDNNSAGLAACGSAIAVSTGNQSTWQQAAASGSADPSTCGFEAGDSILFRINLTAKSNANAYVSNLSFVFNNN